jgi:hypothetical protein
MLTVPLTDSKRKNRNGKRPSGTRTNIPWMPTLERGLMCPPPRRLNEPEGRTSVRLASSRSIAPPNLSSRCPNFRGPFSRSICLGLLGCWRSIPTPVAVVLQAEARTATLTGCSVLVILISRPRKFRTIFPVQHQYSRLEADRPAGRKGNSHTQAAVLVSAEASAAFSGSGLQDATALCVAYVTNRHILIKNCQGSF